MQVRRIATIGDLRPYSATWNTLTRDVPFRSWEWLSTWWEHYGAGRDLYVLAVHDDDGVLVGILPLFRERSATRGRVLQLLGSGEVCTDYVTVLSTVDSEDQVIDAMASWLVEAGCRDAHEKHLWDLLELDHVPTSDSAMARLVGTLSEAGCGVHRKPGLNCWKLSLPASWEEFYGSLSKNRRKAVRKLRRQTVDAGRFRFQTAKTEKDFQAGMDLFVELHQKRRISLGEPGCFASQQFAEFIRDVSPKLWSVGSLELAWIELDEQPVAIEYFLVGCDTAYLYQSGIQPEAHKDSPGHLMTMALIQHSIESSRTTYDLLRGDEPYKADWNAHPHATVKLRVSANRTASQVRQGVWLAGAAMKNWVKGGLTLTGMQ